MTPDDFVPLFRAQPFVPFTVRLNSGESYLARRPDHAMVIGESVLIANPTTPGRQDLVRCAMINVASVTTNEGVKAN